jgi:hypothetical protein
MKSSPGRHPRTSGCPHQSVTSTRIIFFPSRMNRFRRKSSVVSPPPSNTLPNHTIQRFLCHWPPPHAQVALAALKGARTVYELAGHYGVHPMGGGRPAPASCQGIVPATGGSTVSRASLSAATLYPGGNRPEG